jgi:dimethylamine/trimethylamine dehydrogenase
MAGRTPDGPTVIFDDDHYYMGTIMAEAIRATGVPVTLVTTEDKISAWGGYTYDRWRAQTKLMEMQVDLVVAHNLSAFDGHSVTLACEYTGREKSVAANALVLVTARRPDDGLYQGLTQRIDAGVEKAPQSLSRIGDCEAPAIIAAAVYSGHRYARELDATVDRDNPLKHDRVFFDDE